MKTTELRKTSTGTYLRATYGMHKIGDQEPYFSITAEEYQKPRASERGMISCGQMHDAIRANFPELAPLIRWHLCSASGPMHYVANALFWFHSFHGTTQFPKPDDKERAPAALASTVVLGALSDDVSIDTLLAMTRDEFEAFVLGRLPRLLEAFSAAMQSAACAKHDEPAAPDPEPSEMFGVTIKATYTGMEGEMFTWKIELSRAGKVFTGKYSAGFAHCKPVKSVFQKGPREKVTKKIARAFNPFGKITLSDLEGEVTPTPPTLRSYLYCVQSDANSGEHLLFQDFADEFGYDVDSRKAEKIWRACQQTRGELQKFLAEDFAAFMSTDFDAPEAVEVAS